MPEKQFNLRLHCTYADEKNAIDTLSIEVKTDDGWEALSLDIRSPGFLLYINGLFSCQHLYMRTNSAECDVVLDSSEGEMNITINDIWQIQQAEINFAVKIKSGTVTEANHAYILERMQHCPVSSNLPQGLDVINKVVFL